MMGPSRSNPVVDVTGAFYANPIVSCGLTSIIREALREQGIQDDASIGHLLRVAPACLVIREGQNGFKVVITFREERSTTVELPFNSLNTFQIGIISAVARGHRLDQIPLNPLPQLPANELSHYDRITLVVAKCAEGMSPSGDYPSMSKDEGRAPRDYALLARALLAERYAAAGQEDNAMKLYAELCRTISERVNEALIRPSGPQAKNAFDVVGEVFSYLLAGASRASSEELINLTVGELFKVVPGEDGSVRVSVGVQNSIFKWVDEVLPDLAASKHHFSVSKILTNLAPSVKVRVLKAIFTGLDSRVDASRFETIQEYAHDALSDRGEMGFGQTEALDDSYFVDDVARATISRTIALSALRLKYRTVDEVLTDLGWSSTEQDVAGTLAGVLVRDKRPHDAKEFFDNFLLRLDDQRDPGEKVKERALVGFIHDVLAVTPRGYEIAADALNALEEFSPGNPLATSFAIKIVCAAYRANSKQWAEGALTQWIDALKNLERPSTKLLEPGLYHWAIVECLKTLRAAGTELNYRSHIFHKIVGQFVSRFDDTPSDSMVIQHLVRFAGEYGLIDAVSNVEFFSQYSESRVFELCLSHIRSGALEGKVGLAMIAGESANTLLIDAAHAASVGNAPKFEPLVSVNDFSRAYVECKARLLQASLEANLPGLCEEIADSMVGSARVSAPNELPKLLYQLGEAMRRWTLRGYRPFSLD